MRESWTKQKWKDIHLKKHNKGLKLEEQIL